MVKSAKNPLCGSIGITASGSVGDLTVKITYSNCNANGASSSKEIIFNENTTVPYTFSTSGLGATIEFYRKNEAVSSYTIIKPVYVSGMPDELSGSIKFTKGTYTVSVRSNDSSKSASGNIKLSHVSGVNG